jgi:hypothetical protein
LTSGSGRRAYDRIAKELEQFHLTRVCRLFARCGLHILGEKSFVTPDGEKLTPDIVVGDRQTCELVIVDFKNSLAATAVAEVTNRLREYNKGIAQLERYVDRFSRFPALLAGAWNFPRGRQASVVSCFLEYPCHSQSHEFLGWTSRIGLRCRTASH